MKAESTPIGARLIEQEGALDQRFASRSITADALKDATANIGATQAELRNAHLKYHLETAQILSSDQMKRYADLGDTRRTLRLGTIACISGKLGPEFAGMEAASCGSAYLPSRVLRSTSGGLSTGDVFYFRETHSPNPHLELRFARD
jgi:hypothetical protein